MNALMHIPLIAAAAAVAAATVGLTAGLAAASAAPTQTAGTTLVVYPDPTNDANCRLAIKGVFAMNEYDAHGFINNLNTGEHPGGIGYGIVRDEPGSNDQVIGINHFFFGGGDHPGGYLNAQSNGINFFQIISVPKGDLNEDDGVFDDTDEIYVVAEFVDGDSGVRKAYTNPVSGTL